MESKNQASGVAFVLGALCIVASIAGAFSLQEIVLQINKWQKVGYAAVAGVFIALAVVILNQVISFFSHE